MWAPGQKCFRSFKIAVFGSMGSQPDELEKEGILFEPHPVALKGFALKLLEDARLAAASRWRA
jgi:hypothetical protein